MLKRILKNSSYLLSAQLLTKVIAFFYTFFLARNLSVESFGLYTVALSYFSLISAFSELGINRYLIRSVALLSNHPNKKQGLSEILVSVMIFRLSVVTIVFALFTIFLKVSDPDGLRVFLSLMAVSAIMPQAISFTLDSLFVGVEKMAWSAVGILGLNVATTALGVWLIYQGYGVIGATAAIVLGQVSCSLLMLALPFKFGLKLLQTKESRPQILSLELFKDIAEGSLPYGILGVLGLIYFKIDSLMLAYIKGSYEAGIYGAAYKFLEAIVFIPATVATAMFPIIAQLHETSITKIKQIYWNVVQILFGVSIVVLIGFLIVLPILINIFLPEYTNSITVLAILSFAIPFMFIHVPGSLVLLASNKYLKPVIWLSVFTVSFNIIMNLLLIPPFGYIGSAVVTVLSEILSFLVFFSFLQLQVFSK